MSEANTDASTPKNNHNKPDGAGYDEAMIKVLDDVEHVRTRPGLYIGGYNPRGLHHLVYEIVDNSIDEALAGYAKNVEVTINVDGSCTVIESSLWMVTDTSFAKPASASSIELSTTSYTR